MEWSCGLLQVFYIYGGDGERIAENRGVCVKTAVRAIECDFVVFKYAGFCACHFAEVMPKGRAVSFAAFGARGGSGACGGRKIMFCAASAHNNSEHKGEEDRGRFFHIIPLSINFGIYMKKVWSF